MPVFVTTTGGISIQEQTLENSEAITWSLFNDDELAPDEVRACLRSKPGIVVMLSSLFRNAMVVCVVYELTVVVRMSE